MNWAEPVGVGEEIGEFVPEFVISVESSGDGTHQVTVGTASGGTQEMCNPTTTVQATSSGYPNVAIGPFDFPVFLRHTDEDIALHATIYDLTITNVLPGDMPAESGELRATMDFREVYTMFTQIISPTPETVCTALGDGLEAMCQPCEDGQSFCLTLRAVELGASEVSLDLAPVANADPACVRP